MTPPARGVDGYTDASEGHLPVHGSRITHRTRLFGALFCGWLLLWAAGHAVAQTSLVVRWQPPEAETVAPPIDEARVYVFLSSKPMGRPMDGPNWYAPEPFFGRWVRKLRPGAPVVIDAAADGFPTSLAELPGGTYRAQAVLHQAFDSQHPSRGVGNWHSEVFALVHDPATPTELEVVLDQQVAAVPFAEQPWLREIVHCSPLLSRFHGREVLERAAVVLPDGYDDQPRRRYPVIYQIPGFSGTHRSALAHRKAPVAGDGEEDFIRVYLSGACRWGHHVYADSATNGPRGQMLVEELIPHIDQQFRTVAEARGRFVTGFSSGGWASLWLQVQYPDMFGGVWSLSPDPVDFRDFQQIDLYADPPQNMYTDAAGRRRPIARRDGEAVLWYDRFARMDDVLGWGGQLRSFEAVFSPLDDRGQPRRLWNRTTGTIDAEVAAAWQAYDIGLVLERNWDALRPRLEGKLHLVTGSADTYYLEGAVEKLAARLQTLGSDARITIIDGADHGRYLRAADFYPELRRQISARYRQSFSRPKN